MSPFFRPRARLVVRGGAVLGSMVAVSMVTGPTAYAASQAAGGDGGVKVVNTETVQVYLNSDGQPTSKHVYEQLSLTGKGKVNLRNPIATKGLRNLAGFGGIKVEDGEQVIDTTVDGEKKYRSVSEYTGRLPLDVDVKYTLDGKRVEPGDVVGRSGKLAVEYTATNRTGQDEKVSYKGADGTTRTTTEEVVIPMVGSLTTTTPGTFTNVKSDQANIAGDGKGGTKLSFTMTLFPPIGAPRTSFGYTANIEKGVVPRVEVSALPVNPLESPTFSKAAESYQGGADTGIQLTDGAVQIDSNLLKLRDGAKDLLGGLVKLRNGSSELSDGLTDQAAPGAKKLDAGAGALSVGLGKLLDGSGQLKDGSGDLSDGTGKALAGGTKLTGGLKQISGGLNTLQGQLTSKDSRQQLKDLSDGINLLVSLVGDSKNPVDGTLVKGLNDLRDGIPLASGAAANIKSGLADLASNPASIYAPPSTGSIFDADGKVTDASSNLEEVLSNLDQVACVADDTACADALQDAKDDVASAQESLTADDDKSASEKLESASKTIRFTSKEQPGLGVTADSLATKLSDASTSITTKLQPGGERLSQGLIALQDGIKTLVNKIGDVVSGVSVLNSGAATSYTGSGALNNGLEALDNGASKLSAGAVKLADGTVVASDGSKQLSNGATTLSTGLISAASGSTDLAAGLKKATKGTTKLPKGANKLSKEGTQKLIDAGKDTTKTYAQNVAIIDASAQRANKDSMAYGAPKDAAGLTAYSYIIEGDDGEGGRNLTRTLGGAGALLAGGGVLLLRRKFLV